MVEVTVLDIVSAVREWRCWERTLRKGRVLAAVSPCMFPHTILRLHPAHLHSVFVAHPSDSLSSLVPAYLHLVPTCKRGSCLVYGVRGT